VVEDYVINPRLIGRDSTWSGAIGSNGAVEMPRNVQIAAGPAVAETS